MDMLRQYICWVKDAFQPEMSRDAEDTLLAYWQMARNKGDRQTARSTVRMLESLIRLSQVRLVTRICSTAALVYKSSGTAHFGAHAHTLLILHLPQAHARVLARDTVTRQDAIVAVSLLEACSDTCSSCSLENALHTCTPANPDAEHEKVEARITAELSAWQEMLNYH